METAPDPSAARRRAGALATALLWAPAALASLPAAAAQTDAARTPQRERRPNVVLLMADDLGYGDAGYAGHPRLETPHLDAMAAEGVRFARFYAQAPVCSPTRGSCLTGRHPLRYGIDFANTGHLPDDEPNLARVLQRAGYRTGHFGKWHLGTLTRRTRDSNRGGPRGVAHYAPPWDRGFDAAFSTEAKVPTFDPMVKPGSDGEPYGTRYWVGPERAAAEDLDGDDSRVVMNRVLPFVRDSVEAEAPFFAVVWFHAPHLPVVAGPRHRARYADLPGARPDYYGCITAMDEQIGRLRAALDELGVADETLLWFCSDNGPEGGRESDARPGRTGGLRGRKRSLFEGGLRVPGVLVWPALGGPRTVDAPCTTTDFLPTLLDLTGLELEAGEDRPLDGISLLPLLRGERTRRERPIGFASRGQRAWIGDRFKWIRLPDGEEFVFDLRDDPAESEPLDAPERTAALRTEFAAWFATIR